MVKLEYWVAQKLGEVGDFELCDASSEAIETQDFGILSEARGVKAVIHGSQTIIVFPNEELAVWLPFALIGELWDEGQGSYFLATPNEVPKIVEALELLNRAREICATLRSQAT